MIIHDCLTTISCEICSHEFSIERNLSEKTMRRLASKDGWRVVDGKDICPNCAAKTDSNPSK